jgi:hypothetical protein
LKLIFSKENIIRGALIYAAGDSAAALIMDDFSLMRLAGILFLGGIVYAFEIPNYLFWINKHFHNEKKFTKITAAFLFTLYFNPLWIARHLFILNLFQGNFESLNFQLISIGTGSFIASIFWVLPANYIITNVIKYRYRFTISAIFSGLMAVYYALSETLFS